MAKTALITGVTGQDGSYLAELLLEKGYVVHGVKRKSSSFNTERINHLYQDTHNKKSKFKLHYGDLTDSMSMIRLLQELQPDEIYNFIRLSYSFCRLEEVSAALKSGLLYSGDNSSGRMIPGWKSSSKVSGSCPYF